MLVCIRKNNYELGHTLLKWRNIHHMINHPIHHFFAGKGLKAAKLSSETSSNGMSSSTGVSPSKRLVMRSQCIKQLDKWHTFLEKGCFTQADYDEMHAKIMAEMKNI